MAKYENNLTIEQWIERTKQNIINNQKEKIKEAELKLKELFVVSEMEPEQKIAYASKNLSGYYYKFDENNRCWINEQIYSNPHLCSEKDADDRIKFSIDAYNKQIFIAQQTINDADRLAISASYKGYMRKQIHRDNKTALNYGNGGGSYPTIRVPSLKRSKNVWKNFYRLFPELKGLESYCGSKLKKID